MNLADGNNVKMCWAGLIKTMSKHLNPQCDKQKQNLIITITDHYFVKSLTSHVSIFRCEYFFILDSGEWRIAPVTIRQKSPGKNEPCVFSALFAASCKLPVEMMEELQEETPEM